MAEAGVGFTVFLVGALVALVVGAAALSRGWRR